jgi:hypothetical protein
METRDGRTRDYLELNEGSSGLLFGNRFNGFYKRVEGKWALGKASDGKAGIAPIGFNGEHLVFDAIAPSNGVLPTVRFTTRLMDNSAALAHLDLFRRMYKKEAALWEQRAIEKRQDNAVSELMDWDVFELDKTDYSGEKLSSYMAKAKKQAKDLGFEM